MIQIARPLTQGFFELDFYHVEGRPWPLLGYSDGSRWNRNAVPVFPAESMHMLVRLAREQEKDLGNTAWYDEVTDTCAFGRLDELPSVEAYRALSPAERQALWRQSEFYLYAGYVEPQLGITVYPIGAHEWTWRATFSPPGARIRLLRSVDRFPHFVAEAGREGTIVVSEDGFLAARMDEPLPGAEEWDNEIHWNEMFPDFDQDAEYLPGYPPLPPSSLAPNP